MKGMVFTEFIEFVEDTYGFEVTQDMIDRSNLSNNAVFTSVGTYDSAEFVTMVVKLSEIVDIQIPDLLIAYGKHLFTIFSKLYPHFFQENITLFDFINKIDIYIHVEVKKLYPDAELPKVTTVVKEDNMIEIIYCSRRKFGDFAHGLLLGAVSYFGESVDILKQPLEEDGSKVKFVLTRKN